LFQAVKPDSAIAAAIFPSLALVQIADEIRNRTGEGHIGDISGVLADVNRLLDDSIAADRIDKGEQGNSGV